jgi:arylsulfatase A-like enzyme
VASLVDVTPTLLSLIGTDIPPHLHGRNLAPLCRGEPCPAEVGAVIETGHGAALRTLHHLYALPYEKDTRQLARDPDRIFDLQSDPLQQRNLASDPEARKQTRDLDTRLRQWDAETPWMAAGPEPHLAPS